MKRLFGTAIVFFLGLAAGNFIWQAFTSQKWGVAAERSWLQFVAVAVLAVLLAYQQNRSPAK
jgi:hypothetical protein